MFMPDSAPWGAVLVAVGMFWIVRFVRAVWPQSSGDRKELLQDFFGRRGRDHRSIEQPDETPDEHSDEPPNETPPGAQGDSIGQ
ncbi:hypothetical protein O1R50_20500 [Glycomyces luteolus]|uniref:Uncharacterized protein n=1 Tax=Glycomyces luteolus TaxID=2670330 RepID=A0A9X3PEE8_9ACTN|nr:hypothetical protein [Glycomyces luteolus]MDA1362018.1 hypothetical protein [Glycomyces luteolus]